MFLTQYQGAIVGPISKLLGYVIAFIYDLFASMGFESAALAIVLFTIITRALMIPLNIKQQKASKLTSRMNPELQAIQAKYKGKKDAASQAKMSEETQAVYAKYGANPLSGCLPLLITFPLMIALYYIIQRIPAYIPAVNSVYKEAADAILGSSSFNTDTLLNAAALTKNQLAALRLPETLTKDNVNNVIDVLAAITPDKWSAVASAFPDVSSVVNGVAAHVHKINSLFGIFYLNQRPAFNSLTIIFPILAAFLSWYQSYQLQKNQPIDATNSQAASMTKSMSIVMPLMMGYFCFTFPVGIGLYWILGSLFAIVQQFFTNLYLDKIDVDEMIKKNQMKALKRREKLGEDVSKSMRELATTQTKTIDVSEKVKEKAPEEKKEYKPSNYTKSDKNYKSSDIAAIAHMLGNDNSKGEQ